MANELFSEMEQEQSNPFEFRKSIELLFAIAITGSLIYAGYYLFDPATLPIKQVRIEGEFRNLSTSALQNLVSDEVKGGFFNINVAAIRNLLLTEPWVRDVSVHRVWPDSLQVFVTEQDAVASWKDTGLLNRSGVLFAPDKSTFPDDLPVLKGPTGTQKLMIEKYYELQELLTPLSLHVSELNLDARRAWSFETDNGLQVLLGRSNFDDRIKRFVELMPLSLGLKLYEAEKIDMRYPNGFTVRWKQNDIEVIEETGAL